MKTTILTAITRRTLNMLALLTACCVGSPHASAAVITAVVETGGDNEATDTILPKWTGITWNTTIANEPILNTPVGTPYTVPPFGNSVPAFVDRAHAWVGASGSAPIPSYLIGQEHIMVGMDNRDNATLTEDVTVSVPVQVYLLIDNRMPNGKANTTPPIFGPGAMQWILDDGWIGVTNGINRDLSTGRPDEVGVDEGADGTINQWSSIYTKAFPAGTFRLFQADNPTRNFYGIVVAPLSVVEPPAAPTGLTEFSQDTKVTLRWTASAGATEYIIKRATVSGGPYINLATVNVVNYADTTVANGTVYYYVVSASNSAGESANSSEIIARPNIAPVVVATGGTNQVLLTWGALGGATDYTVLRSTVSGGPYAMVASGIGATEFVDTAVVGGARYYYVVAGTLAGGIPSGYSLEVTALTAPADFTIYRAELFGSTVAKLSFNTPNTIAPTVRFESSSDGVSFAVFTNITANTGYALNTGLALSTTNYYRFQASNATGFSSPTPILVVVTPASGINVNIATTTGNSANQPVAPIPPGYLQDVGEVFGDRGNGYSYGWVTPAGTNIIADARYRQNASSPDLRYDTFNHMQKGVGAGVANATWEIGVPNGLYLVRNVGGDVTAVDSVFQYIIEGYVTKTYVPVTGAWWAQYTNFVYVGDGRLTIGSGSLGSNMKLDFVDIYPMPPTPNILLSNPVSLVLTQSRSATFTVVLAGPEPYGVQWYFNNNPVSGANQASYTIPHVQATDEGDYYAVITNASYVVDPGTAVTSGSARLTVIADTVPPQIVSVGSLDGYSVGVCFDEIVDTSVIEQGALDKFNYTVNVGIPGVIGVVLRPDHRSVQLILDGSGGPLSGAFEITAANIGDLAANIATSSGTNTVMGLTARDIGAPALIGTNFVCDSETITLVGSGADIWGTADQFHFASKSVDGDFDARVRVVSLRGSNTVTKAVLMARADDTPGSPTVHLSVNPPAPGRNQFEPGQRLTAGGATASWGTNFVPSDIPNCWLRLTRSGATFRGFRSTNGVDWVLMAVANPVFASSIQVGLGITAHDNTLLATSVFSGFSVTAVTGTDLGVAKIAAQPVVPVGSNLTYTVTVTNHGPAGATGVTLTDPLPAGVTFVSVIASQGSCGQAAGVVTCSLGNLAVATSAQVTIVGTAATAGTKVNTATVTSAGTELNPADNSASASVTVPAPPRITTPVLSGGTAGFSIATEAGVTYMVYYKNSLADAAWTLLTTISGDGTVKPVTDPGPLPPTRFYTVRP